MYFLNVFKPIIALLVFYDMLIIYSSKIETSLKVKLLGKNVLIIHTSTYRAS